MNYTWVFDIIIFAAAVLAVILLRPRNGEFFKDVHSRHPFTSRALGATGMWIFFSGALASVAFVIWLLIAYQILVTGTASAILVIKFFIVLLAVCVNYAFGREYRSGRNEKKAIQKFAVVSCLLSIGMLGSSTNNLFISNMFLDASSMLFTGLLILSANSYGTEINRSSKIAFNYLVVSAVTSVFSYIGSAFILLSAGTYNIQAAAVGIAQNASDNDHLLFNAGVFLWVFKLLFMLGVFPFHFYVFSSSRVLTLPSNFLLFTSLKVPALFTALMVPELIKAESSGVVEAFMVICSIVSIAAASFALYESYTLRHFLSASSVSAISFTTVALAFSGAYPAAVAVLNFVMYCTALSVFLLFYIYVLEVHADTTKTDTGEEIKTFDELVNMGALKSEMGFSEPRANSLGGEEAEESIFDWIGLLKKDNVQFGFNRIYYWRIVLTYISFCLLSLGGVPFTAGFVGKFQIIGLLVHNGYGWASIVVSIASAVSMVWYVSVVFKFINSVDEAIRCFSEDDEGARKKVFTAQEIINIGLVFALPIAILILFTLFGMQGWFMQILTAGMLSPW